LDVGSTQVPSQTISLPGQETVQVLDTHASPEAQTIPAEPLPLPHPTDAPQNCVLEVGSMQLPPHTISLPGQETVQALDTHASPEAQTVPAEPLPLPQPALAPQYCALEVGSMQVPPQTISLPGQETVQALDTHASPEAQTVPAEPLPLPQPALAPQY
jgi:hypothetical protein